MSPATSCGPSPWRQCPLPVRPSLLLTLTLLLMTSDGVNGEDPLVPPSSSPSTATPIQNDEGSNICGGQLRSRYGVIGTPDFPEPFKVPLRCRWIIDASDFADQESSYVGGTGPMVNTSIVVYLTQVYVHRGLRFSEYAYYESEVVNFGGNILHVIDEGNVLELRRVRTFRPYLVIDFELDRLEGNHVRVLDKLLDVYGFNMTYEIGEQLVDRSDSCSLSYCSFTGNCLISADYGTFYCDCFEGFGGEHCGHGPLCVSDRGNPVCQNGGSCRHVGAAAVRCLCLPGYSGDFCEISTSLGNGGATCGSSVSGFGSDANGSKPEGGECVTQCPLPTERPCKCKQPRTAPGPERDWFECQIKLTNVTHPRGAKSGWHGNNSLETYLVKQFTKYLKESKISAVENFEILSVTPTLDVTFHFFGESTETEKIRSSLHKLVMQQRRLGDLFFEQSHFQFHQKPALRLQSLRINYGKRRHIHQGDQFILTCIAVGSSDLKFSWYKDDMPVNISKAMREMSQMRLPSDGSDYHTSMLTVAKAALLDDGVYTCQAMDYGVQQCSHIRVNVRNTPDVKIVPMSSTVEKGSSLRLICTTPKMRSTGIGFGWRKNRALLRLEAGSEIWEDLYPSGSLLSIANATRSAVYTCYVAQSSASVPVEVIERVPTPRSNDVLDMQVSLCSRDRNSGFDWPETKAGSSSLLECPRGFVGEYASRQCSLRGPKGSEWLAPNFSRCLYEPLMQPYTSFQELTLGYEGTNGSSAVQAFWEILQNRKSAMFPGEGDRIISLLLEIEHYQRKIGEVDDLKHSAESVMRIIDKILGSDYSIMNQQNLVLLTQMTARNLEYWSQDRDEDHKHLSLPQMVADVLPMKVYHSPIIMYSLRIPRDNHKEYPDWYNERVTIRLYHDEPIIPSKNVSGIVVVYKNLAQFFPDTYFTELEDGSDLEYRLSSQVVSVSTGHRVGSYSSSSLSSSSSSSEHTSSRFSIELELGGGSGSVKNESGAWNASCGILGSDGSWRLDGCSLSNAKADQSSSGGLANNIVPLHCLCSSTGTFAAFVTARAETVLLVKHPQINYAVILGCSIGLFCSLVSLFVLIAFWWRNRTWLHFLNVQCCIAVAAAMATCIHAVNDEVAEDDMPIVAICLEAFFLVGTSSPISQALVIYAELSHIHPTQQFNPTVIAVITGVPILAMLTTELTRKTIGWKQKSWWLIFDTRVFYIFVICSITLLLTFFLLYIAVIHRTKPLLYKVTKKGIIQSRMRMLHRSAFVIFGITAVEVSSILYVNRPSVFCHYAFATLSTLLGVIIFAAYVMREDTLSIVPILGKLRHHTDTEENSISEQTKVPSKVTTTIDQDRELSTSSGGVTQLPLSLLVTTGTLTSAYEPRGVAVGIEERDYVIEAAARAYQRVLPGGVCTATTATMPHIQIHHVDEVAQIQLQQQQLRQVHMSAASPEMMQHLQGGQRQTPLHDHMCTKLKSCLMVQKSPTVQETVTPQQRAPVGIMKSTMTMCEPTTIPHPQETLPSNNTLMPDVTLAPSATTTDTSIGTSLTHNIVQLSPNCDLSVQHQSTLSDTNGVVTSSSTSTKQPGPPAPVRMPDLTMERKQPDGEADALMMKLQSQMCSSSRLHDIAEEPEQGVASTPANGCVLDQISHDLDYLLNRTRSDT